MPRYEIFYDAACPMCRHEILRLARLDTQQQFILVDISAATFDSQTDGYGLDVAQMLDLLHIRRDDGQILVGVDAIAALYQTIGYGCWTGPLVWPATRGTSAKLYAWIARNRYRLSAVLGFAPRCKDGVCKM